jgi:hypothetical protein
LGDYIYLRRFFANSYDLVREGYVKVCMP